MSDRTVFGAMCGAVAAPVLVPIVCVTSPFWLTAVAHQKYLQSKKGA